MFARTGACLRALMYVWSNASGDHGSKGSSGDFVSLDIPMSAREDITSSIAVRSGDGVRPVPPGDGGWGETARGV